MNFEFLSGFKTARMSNDIQTTSQELSADFAPPAPSSVSYLLQIIGGLSGGVFGTLVMLVVFLAGSSVLRPVLKAQTESSEIHPMFIFVFIGMLFLGSLSANLLSSLFICLSDKSQYRRVSSTIFQIFILNLIIFIFLTPIYVITSRVQLSSIAYLAGLQVILSSLGSAMILKIIAAHRYAIVGVYSSIFSIIVSLGVNLVVYKVLSTDFTILLFAALPIIWLFNAIFEGLFAYFYRSLYNIYGQDFLRSDITYGRDYATTEDEVEALSQEEQENLYYEHQEDVKGADFLQRKK